MQSTISGTVSVLPGRRERKKQALRHRILETARDLFLANGVEATTVDQIAAAADVAPATFFNHFHSKERLLDEMIREVFDRLQQLVEQWLRPPGPTHERIARFADRAATEIAAARGLAHDVLLELVRSSGGQIALIPYLPRVHEAFVEILREGQAAGDVRVDLDATFLAEMVVAMLNGALINWMNDVRYPLAARLRRAAAFVAETIRPQGPGLSAGHRDARPRRRRAGAAASAIPGRTGRAGREE